MTAWVAPFFSPLPSATSKISTTRQRWLCPTLQNTGEFHKSAHLKVGGLRHTGEGDEGNRRGGACNPRSSVVADIPTAPRSPVASGEAAHTTQASRLRWCPWPQKLNSSSLTCGLVPPATKTPKFRPPTAAPMSLIIQQQQRHQTPVPHLSSPFPRESEPAIRETLDGVKAHTIPVTQAAMQGHPQQQSTKDSRGTSSDHRGSRQHL